LGQLHYLSSFTEIGATDLDASVRWYEDVLGFRRIAEYENAVHMRRGEGQDVLLRPGKAGVTLQMATDLDLAETQGRRIPAAGPDDPEAVELRDPDGNVLRIFTRQRPGPTRR
jgi:catechol 2,3-dioxygenase-like lactoylglutathione lyase family enzyme